MSTILSATLPRPSSSSVSAGRITMVGIGGLTIIAMPDKARTVLGSCVGIAIFDTQKKLAGLAHSILPEGQEDAAELGKFADQAVDNLIVKLLAAGADKSKLKVKLVGGATMFGDKSKSDLGQRNIQSARQRLSCHDIPVVAEAVGGTKGRKMLIDPETGMVSVEIIGEPAEII